MNKNAPKIDFFERVSIHLTRMIGSPNSLALHTAAFGGFFILRYLGLIPNSFLLILTAAVCLEAIYLIIFIQMSVKNNTKSLIEVQREIEQIKDEEKEAHKLMINILHLAHQMKNLQHDMDYLKKSGVLKHASGNGHRIHA